MRDINNFYSPDYCFLEILKMFTDRNGEVENITNGLKL